MYRRRQELRTVRALHRRQRAEAAAIEDRRRRQKRYPEEMDMPAAAGAPEWVVGAFEEVTGTRYASRNAYEPRVVDPDEGGTAATRFVVVRVPGTASDISPQIEEARIAVLRAWLPHFLRDYADRFPASGTVLGRPVPPPPFPADCCWERPELVRLLELLKMRSDQLANGEAAGGYTIEE